MHRTIKKVAGTDTSVLIQGENGTGKELIAWEIHRQSERKNQLFVTVDLGSITATLFESELFGHRKGAFTDAKSDRAGRFEAAHGGTLFLDEIGNIPLHLQSKLLSVLQNREIIPVGAAKSLPVRGSLLQDQYHPDRIACTQGTRGGHWNTCRAFPGAI
ncbi:MAG: sigma-54 factor interaction domain-containing protein [Bacteroidota bacterium]|nr:sigma-54 factor interaction domain-containing protein [Bacteroidota bacterium]